MFFAWLNGRGIIRIEPLEDLKYTRKRALDVKSEEYPLFSQHMEQVREFDS